MRRYQKNPRNINVLILAKGNKIRYAPNIPDIAPLAPTMGILESSSVVICPNAASVPQRNKIIRNGVCLRHLQNCFQKSIDKAYFHPSAKFRMKKH
ncbi:MAG: hypothetical protein Ct9H300mP23_06310 [Nitrospinota bacterium]|nr:MAG: hypothetical protein Ct9H300mP23_06310 [Nitrospinota bacterium]